MASDGTTTRTALPPKPRNMVAMTRYRYRLMYSDSRTAPIVEEHDVDPDYADARRQELMARRRSISQRWWVERQPLGAWERVPALATSGVDGHCGS